MLQVRINVHCLGLVKGKLACTMPGSNQSYQPITEIQGERRRGKGGRKISFFLAVRCTSAFQHLNDIIVLFVPSLAL